MPIKVALPSRPATLEASVAGLIEERASKLIGQLSVDEDFDAVGFTGPGGLSQADRLHACVVKLEVLHQVIADHLGSNTVSTSRLCTLLPGQDEVGQPDRVARPADEHVALTIRCRAGAQPGERHF